MGTKYNYILAVGTNDEIKSLVRKQKPIEYDNNLVVLGFNDFYINLLLGILILESVQLRGSTPQYEIEEVSEELELRNKWIARIHFLSSLGANLKKVNDFERSSILKIWVKKILESIATTYTAILTEPC